MTEPRLEHVACLDAAGLHRMAYWEWGERDNPRVVVCVHGLTRQGRDFDTLAPFPIGHAVQPGGIQARDMLESRFGHRGHSSIIMLTNP